MYRLVFVCVLQRSMNLGAKNTALKGKVSTLCELLVNMRLTKFSKYFIRLYWENFHIRFSGSGCHPAIRTSGPACFFILFNSNARR